MLTEAVAPEERAALRVAIDVVRAEGVVLNMAVITSLWTRPGARARPACGTAACLGGTTAFVLFNGGTMPEVVTPKMGDAAITWMESREEPDDPFFELFYGATSCLVTHEEAAVAGEKFLAGAPDDELWGHVEERLNHHHRLLSLPPVGDLDEVAS